MSNVADARIIVAGSGPAGLIAALALAGAGLPVTLIGPEARADDRRTTALMQPALRLLGDIGVLPSLLTSAAPLNVMRIVDATGRLVRSPVVTFHASEIGEDHFGLNIPNADLNAALEIAVAANPAIEWVRTIVAHWDIAADGVTAVLASGGQRSGTLAVAADGRLSPARDAAGIRMNLRTLPQAALVVNFAHSRDHGFVSTEFHTPTGPFTQVPLPGRRSSLVWVESPHRAEELAALDADRLSRAIEERMQSMLGRVAVEPDRQIHVLSAGVPRSFAKDRVALIGEAAHVFPPIGAQGMNLSIRDIRDLVATAEAYADAGSPEALASYDRKRRGDVLGRSGAVGLLNRSLLTDHLPAQLLRSAGLGLVGSFAPLRAFVMREGLQPGSGFAALAPDLWKQVRR